MLDKYNSNQLFLNAKFGLQRVYDTMNKTNLNGISLGDFANQNQIATSDLPFSDLLKLNFKNIDTNQNQFISKEELANLLNSIDKQGLTYAQLKTLSGQTVNSVNTSKKLLDEVIQNFNKIDTNHDGHVSQAEINTYKFNKEIEDKKKELCDFKASNISVFYDGNSTDTADSTDTNTTITTTTNQNKTSFTNY